MRKVVVETELGREIQRLSRAQHGAVGGWQLRERGLTRAMIRTRVARGRLVLQFRDVYISGDPELMPLARLSAALLSLGDAAYLSHRSSLALRGVAAADPDTIDVTVMGANPRPRPGTRIHRVKRLHPEDVTAHQNLRITSLARALIEFAGQAGSSELSDAFGEARAKLGLRDRDLDRALARFPSNDPGAALVRAMLAAGDTYDRSVAERLMRGMCRQANLPQPVSNTLLHGHLADFVWPDLKLILEVDGHGTHGNRWAFEHDRKRDQIHAAAGYLVIRVTWRQLREEPMAVMVRAAQAMAHRAA